jgi:hypothetical protein
MPSRQLWSDLQNDVRVLAAQAPYPGLELDDCELYSSARHGAKEHFHEVILARAAALVAKNDRASATAAAGAEIPALSSSIAVASSLASSPPAAASVGGGLPAAFSRALCHVHRLRADAQGTLGGGGTSQQHNSAASKKPARVLVLQADHDRDSLYNQAMNCIFAAHSMDVVVRSVHEWALCLSANANLAASSEGYRSSCSNTRKTHHQLCSTSDVFSIPFCVLRDTFL